MAVFIDRDEDAARALLRGVGVRFLRIDSPDHTEVMTDVLGGLDQERLRIVAEPPGDDDAADAGMGAWHRNAVNEFETVLSGEGIVEFITLDGPVAVLIGAGDVMVVEKAEHRYRPITAQEWVLRFAADDLGASETGLESGPWPSPGV